jgi:hypothetical protein
MKPTSHDPTDDLHNDAVDHEHSDVNIQAILSFGGIVAVVTVVCAVIVWGFFVFLESQAAARDPKMSRLALPATQMPKTTAGSPYFGAAAQPRLITSEPTVLRTQRASEDIRLHQYGWINQASGVAHVPIDEAKKLIVERGLPSRPAGVDPRLGTHAPAFGEANGGRLIPTGEPAAPAAAAPPAPDKAAAPPSPAPAAAPAPAAPPAHAPSGRGGGGA